MIKARWVYSIIKALEGRKEYVNDMQSEEYKDVDEALEYFNKLEL